MKEKQGEAKASDPIATIFVYVCVAGFVLAIAGDVIVFTILLVAQATR